MSGTATPADLTYETESGTAQIADASLPWSYAFKAKKDDFLYIPAQIVGGDGSGTVSIYQGGSLRESTTSSGFASIATASRIAK